MLFLALPSHKMRGRFRVLRDRRNTLEACQCKRVVFFVAGAALCDVAFRDVVAGAAFCDVAKVLFPQIALAGTRKRDTLSNIVAGAAIRECLEKVAEVSQKSYFLSSVKMAL